MNRTVLIAVIAVVALAGGALFLSAFMDVVVLMGHNIPQEDLATDYAMGVTWALFIGLSILFWPVPGRDKRNLMWAWFAKCVVTLGFMLIYENHYPTDGFSYFDWSRDPNYVWSMFQVGDGTTNMWRLCHLHSVVFPASFHMLKVSFSLVGFISLYLFYRAGVKFIERDDSRVFYALMLFPSLIFWSSIVGKDPIILLGIAIYCYGVAGWYRTNKFRYLLIIALGILESIYIRIWISSILLAPLSIFFISRTRGYLARVVFIGLVVAGFSLSHERFKERFSIETSQDLVAAAGRESFAYGGSAGHRKETFETVGDMALFLPIGMTTALLRPLPGEVANIFGTLAGLENLAFAAILCIAAIRTRWRDLLDPMVLWALSLCIAWSTMYAFVSYQNLGTAARFKMQILPVFLGLLMYLSRSRTPRHSPVAAGVPPLPIRP